MPFYFCIWNDALVEYIGQHGISSDDFEHVVCHPQSVASSRSTGNEIAFGWTIEGQYVACVYERIDRDTLLPITAYPVQE
jgi:hypothetical protein